MSSVRFRSPVDRWLRRAWAGLIILSLVVVASVAYCQHRYRANMNAFGAAQQAAMLNSERVADQIWKVFAHARKRAALEQALFPNGTPTTLPVSDPNEVRWADAQRGVVFAFRFGPDGRWTNYGLGALPSPPPPLPWVLRVVSDLDPYRKMWTDTFRLTIGPILWGLLLAASLVRGQAARWLAHASLAVAWLCLLGWLLNPNYTLSLSLKGIFSNDMLFWGTQMLIASLFRVAYVASRARPVGPNRCRDCGYDLTGNVSGVCPECGTSIADNDRAVLAAL